MSKKLLSFLFLNLAIEFGESLPRASHFEDLPSVEGLICKQDTCLFEIETESRIACSISCKSNDGCLGFFYNHNTKKCAGSNFTLEYIHQSPVKNQDGTSHFHEVFDEIPLPSASSQTSDQTTALMTTTSTDQLQTTSMASTTTQQMTQITSAGPTSDQLWASWNSSSYKILCCGVFLQLASMCDTYKPGHLAWIESEDESIFLGNLMEKSGTHYAFIGVVYDPVKSVLRNYPVRTLFEPKGPWLDKSDPEDGNECIQMDSRQNWLFADCNLNIDPLQHKGAMCIFQVFEKNGFKVLHVRHLIYLNNLHLYKVYR